MISFLQKPEFRQYTVVVLMNLPVLSMGLGIAWTSPVLVKLFNAADPVFDRPITETEGSWIVSIPILLMIFVNLLAAFLVEKIGRKYTYIVACVPRLIGYVVLTWATEVWMVLLGRVIAALSDGMTFNVVPMYASEVASSKIRGGLGTIFQMFISLGMVIMLSMGPFVDYYTLNTIVLCVTIINAVPLLFLPDSPYFLYKKGKLEEAVKALKFLRGSELAANEEIKEYQPTNTNSDEKLTFTEIRKSKTVLKTIGIAIVLGIGSQFTGYNGLTYNLQTVLESTQTSVSSEIASVIIGCIQFMASIMTAIVTDRFGRKPIICTSLVGLAVGLVGLGTFFKLMEENYEIVGFLNFLPLASIVIAVYSYSGGLGALIWPLTSELFDGRTRAVGVTIALNFNIFSLFLVTRFFAPLNNSLGPANLYWIFSFNALAICVFILFCVPETKGRSFAEIQAALEGRRVSDDRSKEGVLKDNKE